MEPVSTQENTHTEKIVTEDTAKAEDVNAQHSHIEIPEEQHIKEEPQVQEANNVIKEEKKQEQVNAQAEMENKQEDNANANVKPPAEEVKAEEEKKPAHGNTIEEKALEPEAPKDESKESDQNKKPQVEEMPSINQSDSFRNDQSPTFHENKTLGEESANPELLRIEALAISEIEKAYNEINSMKEEGNKLINQNQLSEAEKVYISALDKLQNFDLRFEIPEYTQAMLFALSELKNLQKPLFSNLSLAQGNLKKYREAIENATIVIEKFDPYFDKCYARIISFALDMGDLRKANEVAQLMKEKFNESVIKKYQSHFTRLAEKNAEAEKSEMSTLMRGFKKESEPLKETESIPKGKKEKTAGESRMSKIFTKRWWMRLMFGSFAMIGSGLFLMYLIKKRK